jgi:hypothetical protein
LNKVNIISGANKRSKNKVKAITAIIELRFLNLSIFVIDL